MNGLEATPEKEQSLLDAAKSWSRHGLIVTILGVLLVMIVAGTSENIHAQMLKLGPYFWPDYFVLRGEKPDASCDPHPNIEQRLDELEAEYLQENADFDLFESEFDRATATDSLIGQMKVCQKKHDERAIYDANFTPNVEMFRDFEHLFADIALFAINHQKTLLILMLFLSAIVATAQREYISFRSIHTFRDHYLSYVIQIFTYVCLGISTYAYYQGSAASGAEILNPEAMIALILGCAVLVAICFYHTLDRTGLESGGKWSHALLAVPIHSYMLLASTFHFFVREQHLPGIAIYFTQIFQIANLHLAVGLYVLSGMLMKETHIGARMFDVLRPWKLPPEYMALVAIALLGYPCAYTGASGIIIIAMGAVVYQEMRRVGARRQLSLAATALTGCGVVLRPCLMVVAVAVLNKEVVTDELFHWGFYIFILSLVIFAIFAAITRRDPVVLTPVREALPESWQNMKSFLPYVALLCGCILIYAVFLDTYLDEFNAQIVLPVFITVIVLWERRWSKQFHHRNGEENVLQAAPTVPKAFSRSVHGAAVQIGGLLLLQACSYCVSGIIEREGKAWGMPEMFDSRIIAMIVLVIVLVIMGMVMDEFGSLILVSATLAPIAYASGIEPIHFWMMALISFELGYVAPPVALNHLLLRQVVGSREVELAVEEEKDSSFYYRHERYLLPVLVMGTTLLLVAFVPFQFY